MATTITKTIFFIVFPFSLDWLAVISLFVLFYKPRFDNKCNILGKFTPNLKVAAFKPKTRTKALIIP